MYQSTNQFLNIENQLQDLSLTWQANVVSTGLVVGKTKKATDMYNKMAPTIMK